MDRLTSASDRHTTVTFYRKEKCVGPKQGKTIIIIYTEVFTKDTKEREYSDINVKRASITKF